jgi:hypothetical protein
MISTQFTGNLLWSESEGDIFMPLQITLSYDEEHDPFAVQMLIEQPQNSTEDDVVWFFARDLMYGAMQGGGIFGMGRGDIKFRVRGPKNRMDACLSNGSGHVHIGLPLKPVSQFLKESFDVVPDGEEKVDEEELDELIKEILG